MTRASEQALGPSSVVLLAGFFLWTPPAFAQNAADTALSNPVETTEKQGAEEVLPAIHRFERKALATDVQILVYSSEGDGAKSAADAAFAEIDRIEGLMSEWNDDSEINQLNANAGGAPVNVSKDTLTVLSLAKDVSEKSGGAFSSTWAALRGVWNFDVPDGQAPIIPDEKALKSRTVLVDDRKIMLTDSTATLASKGMRLGLGGITKGYAVDRALDVLRRRGFNDVLVFVGGDIASSGRKGTLPWVVGLQEPRRSGGAYFAVITLEDEAIATSGDYEAYFELDGKRYHHLLDPRSGMPAFETRSVSVVSKDAASADAYATAIFILGPEQGLALAEQIVGLEAVIVDSKNQVTVSTGLAKRVRILHQPAE